MAVVVGFSFPETHDNSAAVILDGKLVFATEEERYTRHKHSNLEKPLNALLEAFNYLSSLGVGPKDIDAFALNFDTRFSPVSANFNQLVPRLFESRLYYKMSYSELGQYLLKSLTDRFSDIAFARVFLERVYRRVGSVLPARVRIVPVVHHLAHAASAYYFSGFSNAVILTIDGQGERDSTVIWRVKNGEFERISSVSVNEGSLGMVYESVTERLGFAKLEGEGKVMGLAPYGTSNENLWKRFERIKSTPDGDKVPYAFSREFQDADVARMYEKIADYLTGGLDLRWNPVEAPARTPAEVAFGLQKFTEKMVLHIARWSREQTGERNVALAGGVALNAKSNMELYYSKLYNEMFVFPAANDAGTTIGAAAYVYEHILGERMKNGRLEDVYLGPSYDGAKVKKILAESKWEAKYIGDDVNVAAEQIAKGGVMAWYQGRAEYGPRALGNRSVVADPTNTDNWKVVNAIKGRESWRPLAPSVLDTDKEEYFEDPCDHRFMILMLRMTEDGSRRAPAVTHVDGTSRPQVVSKALNGPWYELIRAFKDLKGEGLVINTSFNLAGEPLVQTPKEAMRSFAVGGFDSICLEGWLITKKH